MDYNLGYVNVEDRVFGKPPIGCVLDLAGRPFSGDRIKDNSPYGNNGAITGATWVWGGQLWVLSFDGNDYVQPGDANSVSLRISTKLTLGGWFEPTTNGTDEILFAKFDSGAAAKYGWRLYRLGADNLIQWDIYVDAVGTSTLIASTTALTVANGWKFVVGTFDSDLATNEMKIFVGGLQEKQGNRAGTINQNNTTPVTIGCQMTLSNNTPGTYWSGRIGLPFMLNTIMTEEEIAQKFQQEHHLFGV